MATKRKDHTEEKSADQLAAEERAAALGNTPVEQRPRDDTFPVINYDDPVAKDDGD